MGKGKGKVMRYCMRVPSNYCLFEFNGFNIQSLQKIKTIFNYKLKTHLTLYSSFFFKKNIQIFKKNENNFSIGYMNI